MTPARIACIDIGSNTTRLLVADRDGGSLTEVGTVRDFTLLGAGRAPGDPLPPATMAGVVEAVGRQLAHANALGSTAVMVVATSAVRSAPNGAALVAAVREAHGVAVRVLGGEEEAAYAFAGATAGLPGVDPGTTLGVVDVGGGSTEIVLGTLAAGVSWSVSLPIGSARLAPCRDPPEAGDLHRLREQVHAAFAAVDVPAAPALALAVGGSATSVCRLVGDELSERSLMAALGVLCSAPSAELAARHGLDERRIGLLPAGLVLLGAAAATLGAPLRVAGGGLREGVLLRLGAAPA